MFTVRSPEGSLHIFTLSQTETDVFLSIEDNHNGTYTCGRCALSFDNSMKVTTHGLTNCDAFLASFETISAIRIDMMLDKPGAASLLDTYLKLQANGTDSEVCSLPVTWTPT